MSGNINGKITSEYFELVMNEMSATLTLDDEEDRQKMGKAIMNEVLQSGGPTKVKRKIKRRDRFIANKIFRPLGEILNAAWAIENIAVYMRSFPYKKQGVSQLSYLQYHIENYLNELYILRARLLSYLDILKKGYRKSDNAKEVDKAIKPLYKVVENAFSGYTTLRGSHVHVERFSDEDIKRLTTLDLLSRGPDEFGKLMKSYFNASYRGTRKKWADKIAKDSKAITELFEIYFGELMKVFFKDKQLIIPINYK